MFTKQRKLPLLLDCYQIDKGEIVIANRWSQDIFLKDFRESGKPFVVINTIQDGKESNYYRRHNPTLVKELRLLAIGEKKSFTVNAADDHYQSTQNFVYADLLVSRKVGKSHRITITEKGIAFLQHYDEYKRMRRILVIPDGDISRLKKTKKFY